MGAGDTGAEGDVSLPPHEAQAVLAARAELGPDYERELAESFADRIERIIEQRTDAPRQRQPSPPRAPAAPASSRRLTLGMVSVACGIPITAISAGIADLPGLLVAWTGLVGVNLAHAMADRNG